MRIIIYILKDTDPNMKKKDILQKVSAGSVVKIEQPVVKCRNCSTEMEGEYCHFCGQRHHDHKESFGELVYEFVSDFLHFDSRFFKTILPLLFVPGKVTKSYNEGRQRSQFHPIRLYLFSSFLYFFLFFYFTNIENRLSDEHINANPAENAITPAKQISPNDTLNHAEQTSGNTTEGSVIAGKQPQEKPSAGTKKFITLKDSTMDYSLSVSVYIDSLIQAKVTPEQYLAQQQKLPEKDRDSYFERILTMRLLKINQGGEEGKKEFFKKLTENFFHNIPKMLFFLLPVFALFLKLLYIRKKQFYYVDHAILSLHYFSLIFLLLVLGEYILDKIFGTSIFTFLAFVWMSVYLLIAMKRLYGEKWIRTILKFIAVGVLLFVAILASLVVNMAWSAFMM